MSLAISTGRMMLHRATGRVGVSLAFLLSLPMAAVGAPDCKQAGAAYVDSDGAYELRFKPIASEAASASNLFTLKVLKTALELDGYVMPSEDPARAAGILMFQCPDGDATGADLDACTIWQGPVYGVDAEGRIDNLQPEAAVAADKILLPGLGPAIRQSKIWGNGKVTVAPWDLLTFKECAK